MSDPRHTHLVVDGDRLRVSVEGQGEPVLLIMGLGGNIEMWGPLATELHRRGFQTIAYDAPGTGDSPPRLVPRRMSGLARQAAHLLEQLGYPSAHVLGVSFGGGVAQQLALSNPDRVRRLVLAATACGVGGIPGNPLALMLLATPLRYYSPRFLRATARYLYGPATPGTDLLDQQALARHARPPNPWGYAGQLWAGFAWTSLPWLHRLRMPTLVLAGESDLIVPPVNGRILAYRIPSARLQMLAGAGHLFLLERAGECGVLIADFLANGEARMA
jgi:poly(3-hydroxyoctanoate) depolymerase